MKRARDLSISEAAELESWRHEMRTIARSRSKVLAKWVVMRAVENSSTSFSPQTGFITISVTRDCLAKALSPTARSYLIAHELGHAARLHGILTVGSTALFLAGLWALSKLINIIRSNQDPVAWLYILLFLGLCGVALLVVDRATMCFEWAADNYGAKLISSQKMLAGMEEVRILRPPEHAAFYERKRANLMGTPSSVWIP